MSRSSPHPRGFTMIEMMIVVAIIGVITALAGVTLARARPRANLAATAVDLHALLHGARQQALLRGNEVVVMFFPGFSARDDVVGRVVVYEDGDHDFFSDAAGVNFDAYSPDVLGAGPRSEVISVVDLPAPVRIGPTRGWGTAAVLPAPLNTIPVTADCTFCAGGGADRRGAVAFDSRGQARFFSQNGPPLVTGGGSVSLEVPGLATGSGSNEVRTVTVAGSTGAVRVLING